ncbi:ATP synthase F1 subunit delta [Pelobium manganitolerans]|uniref:ATP synthase subunit delta n=1 Tax=Pelobium manganitolerans TaxID=1842495 RepID=A0A419S2C3_9SPHI|nr:ATP synthase F1 subunit delta [Pelobium manganitolerans]RKD12870.1 ATP synthase F1 subunit delta [Pelobium manganitolerans]
MSEIKVASRYAKSLLDLALENNALEEIKGDMDLFVKTLSANRELQAVVKNPIIPLAKKNAILKAIFGEKINRITASFFKIVVDKGRADIIFGTAKEFLNQYDRYKNIVTAKVVSAAELSETAKTEIVNKVKAVTGGEVKLVTRVDPSLIGGFVLTLGDKQFDASIASNLSKLKKDFAQKVVA